MTKARELAELARTISDTSDATAITIDSSENTTFTGVVTANAGVVIDSMTIDAGQIDLSSGDLTLDVAGGINLDSDGGEISFKDDGTEIGKIFNSSSDFAFEAGVQDKDILFRGNDGGSAITALTLDMSAAGAATFNAGATFSGSVIAPGLSLTGAITTNSTVDGRDVATDGTKLDGIEASADVTDATNVTAAGALMDSELTAIASVKALNQGVATTDDPTFTNTQLAAIAQSKSDTAIDVFVYDTRKDSDGGAWRHRTQHTSWYNETLNTSTRGATKKFPSVAVIVTDSSADTVTIYDGDNPDIPMWMVFTVGSQGMANSVMLQYTGQDKVVHMLNGVLVVGHRTNSDNYGNPIIKFISEKVVRADAQTGEGGTWQGNIANRNNAYGYVAGGGYLIPNSIVNDVAMTVLPNAPIDLDTGLPVPTIAVATNGGVSVIKDDGSVVDITVNNASYTSSHTVEFLDDNSLGLSIGTDVQTSQDSYYIFHTIPTADNVITVDNITGTTQDVDEFYSVQKPNAVVDLHIDGTDQDRTLTAVANNAYGTSYGVSVVDRNKNAADKGMIAYMSADYNTGWMNGDIKLATLSSTDDTNISASGNTNILSGGWTNNGSFPYETFTTSGLDITSAINTTAYGAANKTWNSVAGKTYTAYFNLTLNSGTAPTLFMQTPSSFGSGRSFQTVNGINSFTFTATISGGTYFSFSINNGVATNFSVANLELYEGGVVDRSVNGTGLSVFGTVTKTAVATGADLVAYSGFSSSNYLEQPYTSALDFNSGDFSTCFWTNNPNNSDGYIWDRADANSNYRMALYMTTANGGSMNMYLRDASAATEVTGIIGTPNEWAQVWCIRRGTTHEIWVNGVNKVATVGTLRDVSSANGEAKLHIATRHNKVAPNTGKIALLRISATAPSAEQIAKSYSDEKHLFQENAKATLYGSSDAVRALAYDDDTELLHAGTSGGRSVFQGLRRVDNTTDAVGAAISASNGLVAED